jgi:hypothetical protein
MDVVSYEDFDKVESLGIAGWHIHYVFEGNECVKVTIELNEDTAVSETQRVKDILTSRGLSIKDVANQLAKLTGKQIMLE